MENLLKKYCFLLFSVLWMGYAAHAQAPYAYHIDLSATSRDRVPVVLHCPQLEVGKIDFHLPKVVPGTYDAHNYGRFVHQFRAFDKEGRRLKVRRKNDNTWTIQQADHLHRIEYWVEDTWDTDLPLPVFEPSGTNIEKGEHFLINTFGFCGFFEGKKDLPVELTVTHPEALYGSGALPKQQLDKATDRYTAKTYHMLADSPIMYAAADTTSWQLANTRVTVSLYSPNDVLTSEQLAASIVDVLEAQQQYLGGEMPVDHYAFLVYLSDKPSQSGGMGALEHSYSSFYFLPESASDFLLQTFRDIAAHEFFHILTPLGLHAEQIADFDYVDPEMSEHLWLYEGVTEYFAHHVQVKYGLISLEQYLGVMKQKIDASLYNYDNELPFTELSRECMGKHSSQYGNVYEKGAVIGMCLDILLLHHTDGALSLVELVQQMVERYGPERAFKDEELFGELVALSGVEELQAFFDRHVKGDEPLPLTEVMALAGLDYYEERTVEVFTMGNVDIDIDEQDRLLVVGTADADAFGKAVGYRKGDVLLSINGTEVNLENVSVVLEEYINTVKEGDVLELEVIRKGEQRQLRTEVFAVPQMKQDVFEPMAAPSARQQKVFSAWLGQ